MSANVKPCNVCGTKNSSLHFCIECGLRCCQQCLDQHKSNKVCGLIKEHLSPTNVICMRHKSCYTKFCLKCCLLFCPECADRHSDHNMDLFSIIDAVKKIRRDIPKCVDSLSEKVIDAHKFVTAFPAKMNELLSLQRQIDVEENVWCTKIKERAEGLCRQIKQQMTELDSDCIIQQQYEQNARETILTLNAVEKVKYSNTFALLWVCIKKKLDQFESNAAKKNILQRLSFQLGVEDHSKLFDMFGSLKYVNIGEDLDLDDGTLELFKKMKIDDQDEDHRRYEKNTEENRKLEADVERLTCQLHDSTKKSEISLEKKETEIQRLKNQIELSCVAEEKLTKNNAAIMDLGDPNRPMRIGVKFGELYDSEWTNAIENISNVKKYYPDMMESEIQEIIIRHLHRLLKCCYRECLMKAEEQIHTLGETLAETMCITFKSKDEITSLPVCREAAILRRATSEGFAKHLFQNQVLCKNIIADWDYINKNEKVMQIFTQSMFFEKCVNLCWCMVIQDPVLHLDDDQVLNTQIDKHTYEEFEKSGDSAAYVVWPALFLHKGGPLLCKGVVKAYSKKDYET